MKKVLTLICMVLTAVLGVITLAACGGDGEGDKITVTYYFGNEQKAENVLKTEEIEVGGKPTEWTPEARNDGYTFIGWYGTPNYVYEFDFNQALDKDTVVFSLWTKAEQDDNRWEIAGSLKGDALAASDWGTGNKGVDDFLLTKVEGTLNQFTGTFELYEDDAFQFAVLDFEGATDGKPDFTYQIGFGCLDQGDNTWFEGKANPYDPTPYKLDIIVKQDGKYKFTLTTDNKNPAAAKVVVERLGDPTSLDIFFAPVIGGTAIGGGLGDVTKHADLFLSEYEIGEKNVTFFGEVSLNAGELMNILLLNNWDIQLKSANLDVENSDHVVAQTGQEFYVTETGKYKVSITASKDVVEKELDGQVVANKATYKTAKYAVTVEKVTGDYEKATGVNYDTFNVTYPEGLGTNYTVYLRDGSRFPKVLDPQLAEGEIVAGWEYETEDGKLGIGVNKNPMTATGKTYDLTPVIVDANDADPREWIIQGTGLKVNDKDVTWSSTDLKLTKVEGENYKWEATLVVTVPEATENNPKPVSQFQVISLLHGVNQGVSLRCHNVKDPGDFIDKTNASNIAINKSGTYKLVLDAFTNQITITVVE